ncbi:MAG: hypothetical protein M9899_04455 [Bdellovibrionaceae bacterium]|nr:hypothetical protein [Pseudobdellovibrionaceae bacterium]
MKKKKAIIPKTKFRFSELLGDTSILELADEMGVTYTQLYPYKKPGVNPTLLAMEQIAEALSRIRHEKITVIDLIDPKGKKKKKKSK